MPRSSARFRNAIPRLLAFLVLPFTLAGQGTCPDLPFDVLGHQGYRVRQVDIVGPLSASLNALRTRLPQHQSPVTSEAIEAGKAAIREDIAKWLILFNSPISVTVVVSSVTHCTNTAPFLLTVEYRFFTTKISTAVTRSFEARSAAVTDPGRSLASRSEGRLELTPKLGYNRSEQVFLGGRLAIFVPRFFNRVIAEGYASSRAWRASISADGGADRPGTAIARLDWRIGYGYEDQPTNRGPLRDSRIAAQVALTSKPTRVSGVLWRYAAALEGGSQRSDIQSVPHVASARFSTLKQALGLTLNTWTQAVNLSYGFQLGRVPDSGIVSYSKHILDLSHAARFKSLQLESRVNGGVLLQHGPTPLNERFIGGGGQAPFLSGGAWAVNANPFVRSIPNFWLNSGAGGQFGSNRFAAFNLTASMPTWRYPLVPNEIRNDPQIRDAIDGLLTSAESVIAALEKTRDQAHLALFNSRRAFQTTIQAVESCALALNLDKCADQAGTLGARIADLRKSNFWGPFLDQPTDPDDVSLPSLQTACFTNATDPELLTLAAKVEAYRQNIATQISRIDIARTRAIARQQMSFPRKTVETMIEDMDVFSISPVALLDVAYVSPRSYYALGGGLRLTLASSIHFTLTYAYNPRRHKGEAPGTLLFSLGFTNLFGSR